MSAIAGLIGSTTELPAEYSCAGLLEAQAIYGPHDRSISSSNGVSLGRNLFRLLPEDQFDRQPEIGAEGRFTLVADLRIDNRDELLAAIGLTTSERRHMSDAAILLRAWIRWGAACLDRLRGDFAFALWDSGEQQLHLARDPIGQRPLHYVRQRAFTAFASMPEALLRLIEGGGGADEPRLAQFVADLPNFGPASFYRHVQRVEPGTHVMMGRQGAPRIRRYWQPSTAAPLATRADALVAEFRERLDRAVAARSRRASGKLGSHLSSGMDSSAVTATAARLDPAESILAFTSAPRSGFDGPVPVGRIADETGLAALVALAHPNIQHIVCRPAGMKPLALLGRTHALAQQPTGHVCNNSWWCAINDAARDRGVTVMLTGELGNLAFSAGGYSTLEDLVRAGRIGRWLGEARASGLPWRTLADFSFAGLLPAALNDRVRRFFTRALPPPAKPPFLAADHHALADVPPLEASSARALQLELIRRTDPGCFRKAVLAGWGIDERDPTADRDLVEFCLTLPLDALLKDGVERPLLKATLADRLPRELLNQSLRGYQMADWYEQIRPADVRAFASELRNDHRAAALLDWDEVEEAIDNWPNRGWEQRPLIYRYRMRLLRALAAAEFVRSRPDHALQPIARSAG